MRRDRCELLKFLFFISGMTFLPSAVSAQSITDLLEQAVEDYIERKSKEAGLVPSDTESDSSEQEVQKVLLSFDGVVPGAPDVFQALYSGAAKSNQGMTGTTAAEQNCFARVQDKIAWNYQGNKHWSNNSINNLCRGTTKAAQPPNCFSRAMFKGHQWGKKQSHNMTWTLASQLCTGTNNSDQKIACLKQNISQNKTLAASVNNCGSNVTSGAAGQVLFYDPRLATLAVPAIGLNNTLTKAQKGCIDYVQGRIAWDPAGKNKSWTADSVSRLCGNTTAKYSPGNCFKYVMRRPDSWGKKASHSVDWRVAVDLCEGTSDARETTTCFKSQVAKGKSLTQAIRRCET